MFKANVSVKNIDGFDAQLEDVLDAIEDNLDDIAKVVKAEADTTAEFVDKTGLLRKSNKKRKSKFEDGGYIVFNRAPHAHLVEFGHVKFLFGHPTGERVPAHPFMRHALEKGFLKALEIFRRSK